MFGRRLNANDLYFTVVLLIINVHRSFTHDEYADVFGDVVFANVLFRHGDRTPIDPYPTDPYRNLSFWPDGYGQLTKVGKEQAYQLGQWLKSRYSHLVGEYNKQKIYVQSTDVDRTLMSAECNMAGLFPPDNDQKWNPSMHWQPVPIHTLPENLDKVLAGKAPCPRYKVEMEKATRSKEMQELNKKYASLYNYLTLHTGREIQNISQSGYIYDILFIETTHNYTLPNWTKSIYPYPLAEAALWSFTESTWTKELGRLKVGLLIGEMVKHLKEKHEHIMNPDQHLWFYSAHDSTIANMLHTLGVFEFTFPPYSSAVMMELRKKDDQPFVTLFYHNSTTQGPYLLTIPGCTAACPLNQFLALTNDVIPKDWDLECHAHYLFGFTSDLPYNNIAIFAMVTSSLLIFLLVTSMTFYWQKKKPKHVYRKLKTDNI